MEKFILEEHFVVVANDNTYTITGFYVNYSVNMLCEYFNRLKYISTTDSVNATVF